MEESWGILARFSLALSYCCKKFRSILYPSDNLHCLGEPNVSLWTVHCSARSVDTLVERFLWAIDINLLGGERVGNFLNVSYFSDRLRESFAALMLSRDFVGTSLVLKRPHEIVSMTALRTCRHILKVLWMELLHLYLLWHDKCHVRWHARVPKSAVEVDEGQISWHADIG